MRRGPAGTRPVFGAAYSATLYPDAEARLRGMRWWLGAALAFGVVICALAGCLRAVNDGSRAVARWEVRR